MELFSLLLKHDADIEVSDPYGWRALHIACYRGHKEIVQTLIAKGADIHIATKEWNDREDRPTGLHEGDCWAGTPLHLACMGGHLEIVRILLDLGVDVHASTKVDLGLNSNPMKPWQKFQVFVTPGHGPTALHLVLDTGDYYHRLGEVLSEDRLGSARLLVMAGARVEGVLSHMGLEECLRVQKVPGLWEGLRG